MNLATFVNCSFIWEMIKTRPYHVATFILPGKMAPIQNSNNHACQGKIRRVGDGDDNERRRLQHDARRVTDTVHYRLVWSRLNDWIQYQVNGPLITHYRTNQASYHYICHFKPFSRWYQLSIGLNSLESLESQVTSNPFQLINWWLTVLYNFK